MDRETYSQLAQPFQGNEQTGRDASHSDAFSAIEEQIEKTQGLSFAEADWQAVEQNAVTILQEQSKDLRVAGYLTVSLYEQYGFTGLATGFQILADMLKADYWPTIFPNRKRKANKARASAFSYINTHLEKSFSHFELTENSDFEALAEAADLYLQIDQGLQQWLEEDAPYNNAVRSRFRQIEQEAKARLEQIAKEKVEQKRKNSLLGRAEKSLNAVKEAFTPTRSESEPEQPASPESKPEQPQPTSVDIPTPNAITCVSKENMEKALSASRETLLAVAKALRSANSMEAWAFYLVRTAQWMVIDEVPGNNVMPPNPSEQQMDDLKTLLANKQYAAVVEQGEKFFEQGAIFSGALHRIVANALESDGHAQAAFMVKSCLQQLHQRLPTLTQNKFTNGDPFIDGLTLSWLGEAEKNTGNSTINGSQTGGSDVTNNNTPWADALSQATALLSKGQFNQGIEIFTQGVASVPGLRERTYWQLAQARFCEKAEHLDLALSQLQALEQFVGNSLLSEWEPQLRVAIITELLQCHEKKMAKTTYTAEQKQALAPLYSELSLKAPMIALSITINE